MQISRGSRLNWNKKTAPHCYFGRGRRRTIIGGSNALTKEADPNDDLQSFEDKVASRVWELGRYTRSQIENVLQQAVRDQVSGEEAARRVEALLLEDQPLAEAHYRLGSVSIGEALRSLMLVQKDDPKVRSTAADLRKEFVADEHPRAAELEDAIAQMFVEILRGDPETAEAVRALAPPPPEEATPFSPRRWPRTGCLSICGD